MVMVHHHIKYKEIHGEDVVVLMEKGEHAKLHARLRREKKCNIPSSALEKISDAAYYRRSDVLDRMRAHRAKRYVEEPKILERRRVYHAMRSTVLSRLRPDIIEAALL